MMNSTLAIQPNAFYQNIIDPVFVTFCGVLILMFFKSCVLGYRMTNTNEHNYSSDYESDVILIIPNSSQIVIVPEPQNQPQT